MIAILSSSVFLSSLLDIIQNPSSFTPTLAYAHHDDGDSVIKKNKSLIHDILDKIVTADDTNKAAIEQILQQIQTQITQRSGQEKATAALKQIRSLIELNPNGTLSQSILSLAKQQASGNTAAVNQAAVQIATLVASGGDYVGQPLQQSGASSPVVMKSSSSTVISSSAISNTPSINVDDKDNNKEKNKSLINEISDKVVSGDTNKAAIEQILQQIQTQITQRSGQEKATAALKQIRSLIELNPNGTLSQSILSLAKQQASGNTAAVNQAAVQIATLVASGGDYVGQPLQQSGASSPVVMKSSSSTVISSSAISNTPSINVDDKDNNKEKNKSLINEISDKVVSGDTNKAAIEQILQQIQTQITQRSGQEKATAALKQIRSLIELNPNGTLSQSILSLAKQQASGNTAAVNQTAVQIATLVASGGDYVGQPLQQSGASSPVVVKSSSSTAISSSAISNTPSINVDDKDNNKEKNKSLINEISDKVVSGDTSKAAIEQILQQIQTQITQRSGQEKATAALKQIRSLIELNPNGTLSQSILSLAKQQASGNTAAVNQTAVQIATFVASGGDYVGQPLQQSGASSPVTAASSSPSSSPSSSSPVTA